MNINSLDFRSFDPSIPEPISFNSWKHHLGFIQECIGRIDWINNSDSVQYQNLIKSIGGTLVDLYTGNLSAIQIAEEIINVFDKVEIHDKVAYYQWVNSDGKEYRCIYLSDGSKWALRIGKLDNRFIHIHPGRNSNNTIRVKSTTLKTAIAYLFMYGPSKESFNIENINLARQNLALLPPMKRTSLLTPVSNLLGRIFS